jgi:hypothetical protein
LKLKEKSNKPTSPKHTKAKKDKTKKEEVNGHHINGFLTARDYVHTNGVGVFANNNQKYNNGSSSSSNMIRNNKQFIRSLHPGTRTTTITNITNSRNIVDNRQIPSPTSPSTANRIVSTSSTTTFNRIVEYSMLYLQRMISKMSVPGFLFFIMILFMFSNKTNIKEKLRDVLYKWLAKSWQTLKAGTTITYV